jgi:hypothetical protein
MPKKSKGHRRRRGGARSRVSNPNKVAGMVVSVPFDNIYSASLSSSAVLVLPIAANSTSIPGVHNASSGYEFYRYTSLRVKLFSTGFPCVVAYRSAEYNLVPSSDTFTNLLQSGSMTFMTGVETVPSTFVVPGSIMKRANLDWYNVSTSSSTEGEDVQGNLFVASTATQTSTAYIQVSGVAQFKAVTNSYGADLKTGELEFHPVCPIREFKKENVVKPCSCH